MTTNLNWNPKKIYKESVQWLDNPENQEFIKTDLNNLERYLRGKLPITYVPVATMFLATVHMAEAVTKLWDDDPEGIDHFYYSLNYNMCEMLYHQIYLRLVPANQEKSYLHLNATGLWLADAIPLGNAVAIESLGSCLLGGFQSKWFHPLEIKDTRVAPFILALYTQAYQRPFPEDLRVTDLYTRLLRCWQSEDEAELTQALLAACDFHLECSRRESRARTYEFGDWEYAIHPVELLALYRLREMRGLSIPVINHSLMHTPMGRLYPVKVLPQNPLLEKVTAKLLLTATNME